MANGLILEALPDKIRSSFSKRFFLSFKDKEERISAIEELNPETLDYLIQEAEQFSDHYFQLLGSDPTFLGEKIDWHADFKSGYRWNERMYFRCIQVAPYPGGFDIKIPWELSRCQHFVRLGQAYWASGDENYAKQFVDQVEDWIQKNPYPLGVNWACTMDVAIRAVNWLWGLAFFIDSASISDNFLINIANSLLVHGRHIYSHLEWSEKYRGNHYLADLAGLIYLGILLPVFNESSQWLELGIRELNNDMVYQVYSDGVDYEASISYHRLVTEIILSPILLCIFNKIPVPVKVLSQLEKMLDFIMTYTKPDGTVPLMGDADNGRVHRISVWKDRGQEWLDHRYLLGIGAVLYDRVDFATAAGDQWQEAIWFFGKNALTLKNLVHPENYFGLELQSKGFSFANQYVLRKSDQYLYVDCGKNGMNSYGCHAHNDTLSFELYSDGQSWIIDPGMSDYTGDYKIRNLLRSSACHNTVVVDRQEINPFPEDNLFLLKEVANAQVTRWITKDEYDFLEAHHRGYTRLPQPVIHQRIFYFNKQDKYWIIQDNLSGQGEHSFDFYFHFGSSISLLTVREPQIALYGENKTQQKLLILPVSKEALSPEITMGLISPGYGQRTKAPVGCYHATVQGGIRVNWIIYPCRDLNPETLDWLKEREMEFSQQYD